MKLDFQNSLVPSTNGLFPFPYPISVHASRAGIGIGNLDPQSQAIAGIAATGAATTAQILVAMGTIGGPVGAAIAGLAAAGVAIANLFGGCGQTCVAATNIANQAEPILADNLHKYASSPIRYRSMQLAALNNFDITWAALQKACSDPGLQDAGRRCISDRQRGACVWHSTNKPEWIRNADGTYTLQEAGPATDNGPCWNWFSGYRDPIANDPGVLPDPTATDQISSSISSAIASTGIPAPLLIGGFALLAFTFIGGSSK